jgi:hypothetical protein
VYSLKAGIGGIRLLFLIQPGIPDRLKAELPTNTKSSLKAVHQQ